MDEKEDEKHFSWWGWHHTAILIGSILGGAHAYRGGESADIESIESKIAQAELAQLTLDVRDLRIKTEQFAEQMSHVTITLDALARDRRASTYNHYKTLDPLLDKHPSIISNSISNNKHGS